MSSRTVTPARALLAVTVLMYAGTVALGVGNAGEPIPDHDGDFTFTLLFGLALLSIAVVGELVASRQPRHPIGWILLGSTAVMTLSGLGEEYATYTLYGAEGLPGTAPAAWLTEWLFIPMLFVLPALLLLLFPDGRPASPRWRLVIWLAAAGSALYIVASMLHPGTIEDTPFEGVANPIGVDAWEVPTQVGIDLAFAALAMSVVLGAISMVLRLRRSHGVERAQLKWVAVAAGVFALCAVVGVTIVVVFGSLAGAVFVVLSFPLIPVTAGVAILRHRLYDVDVVIRRTLIYGPVTATLLAVYVGLVLVLGAALQPLANGSDLVVAISTLAVAALFGPVRRRAQAVVDRRFYRRRYDAELTIDRFASDLRVNTDLESVGDALTNAVDETVQPSHVSLWLRPQAR